MNPLLPLAPLLALILALAAASGGRAAADDAPARPNFLFLYSDDQRWDSLSVVQREQGDAARFPWVETPNLDRLAAEGLRFRNAFVTNSLCAPCRASFLTGLYSHLHGVAQNFTPFPPNNVTYASLLRQAGYVTGYIGKWHMDGQAERPGFDYAASYVGQGTYVNAKFLVNGAPEVSSRWVDDQSTDYAVDFLRQNAAKPFVLVVGFKSPHDPQRPAPRNRDLYEGETVRPALNAQAPPSFPDRFRPEQTAGTPPKFLNYFRCIAGVDQNVGRLLDTLDQLKLADNTVVVFTSDSGYFLGEHGLLDKRGAYEESIRIPLLVRAPFLKTPPGTVDALALNIDIAPTFLELAGLPVPKEMQGRSLLPLLRGSRPADWRTSFFYEYFYEKIYDYFPSNVAVRTEDAKLIAYPNHPEWTEVFDLAADPRETHNLANDPAAAALRARLEKELEHQKEATGYLVPSYADPDTFGDGQQGDSQ